MYIFLNLNCGFINSYGDNANLIEKFFNNSKNDINIRKSVQKKLHLIIENNLFREQEIQEISHWKQQKSIFWNSTICLLTYSNN